MVWEELEWLLPLEHQHLTEEATLGAAQRAEGGASEDQPQTKGRGSVPWGERHRVFEPKL